jgi:drug/metabolite transporter (DMT)-like permease
MQRSAVAAMGRFEDGGRMIAGGDAASVASLFVRCLLSGVHSVATRNGAYPLSTSEAICAVQPRVAARPMHAYLALLVGMLAISFTAIFTKWAAVPGPVAAAYRMTISALALTIPFFYQRRGQPRLAPRQARWGVLGGLWFALNLGLLNSALLLTSAANATLLDNSAPIWVGLGAMVFLRERLQPRYWIGLGLALVGAAVVTGFSFAPGFQLNQGDALALVGATFYAGYLLITQRGRRDLDTLSYLWLVAVTAALVLLAGSLAMGLPLLGYSGRSYLALLAVGLISQTAGWLLINYALGYLPASSAVVILLGQPAVTGLLAAGLLGEPLAPRQVLGGALELSGIYLCLRRAVRGK